MQSVLVMIIVAFVSFSLFNFVGDPVNSMTGEDASDERRAEVREVLGLNDPVYILFSRFLIHKFIIDCICFFDARVIFWDLE